MAYVSQVQPDPNTSVALCANAASNPAVFDQRAAMAAARDVLGDEPESGVSPSKKNVWFHN